MNKRKLNLTLDYDLIDYAKLYANENRTTVSDIITQFLLNLKRVKEKSPTEQIIADENFHESIMHTIQKLRKGNIRWHSYNEVF